MKNKLLKIGFILLAMTGETFALSVSDYYKIDMEAMEISKDGATKRLECLKRACPLKEQYAIYDTMQKRLYTLYNQADTTSSKLLGYYTKNATEMKKYYENNSTLKEKYETFQQEMKMINTQIDQYTKVTQ